MRSTALIIAIAFLAALVAGQSKVMQIDDGQVQGPEIHASYPCPVTTITPCPIIAPPAPPKVSGANSCSGQAPAASRSGVMVHTDNGQIQIHKPTPSAPPEAPCPPIAFEGGALARKYPVGGAVAAGAVAVAFAMI
ncbi:unnamed protein product [Tuber aestivum]|uniref:Uncharacterized protein n=1 Tax=Tuber aestivum TaxID=59557 RepID=A0A292PW32_9PEZI|nr:unnamed protein product [Tuber aestivum]